MHKSIVITEKSRLTITVTDLGQKPGALVFLWDIAEYNKPTTTRRVPMMSVSLLRNKPRCQKNDIIPGKYVLESATLPDGCFEIEITQE